MPTPLNLDTKFRLTCAICKCKSIGYSTLEGAAEQCTKLHGWKWVDPPAHWRCKKCKDVKRPQPKDPDREALIASERKRVGGNKDTIQGKAHLIAGLIIFKNAGMSAGEARLEMVEMFSKVYWG